MRILFAATPGYDHILGLAPIAKAALRRGHEVAVAAPERFATATEEDLGLTFMPAGHDWVIDFIDADDEAVTPDEMEEFTQRLMVEQLCGDGIRPMARDVLAIIEQWRPDLIVRDSSEFGSFIAAEKAGVPHASVAVLDNNYEFLHPEVLAALSTQCAAFGLPPVTEPEHLFPHFHVNLMPLEFAPEEASIPNIRTYCMESVLPGQQLPDWMADLDTDLPLVYASFGTAASTLPEFAEPLSKVITGLGEVECTAIVSVGKGPDWERDTELSAPQIPGNVRVVEWVPQAVLLRCVDLWVTHLGPTAVRQVLHNGLPVVAVPLLFGEFDEAQRCADRGFGVQLDWTTMKPQDVAAACRRVLETPTYRRQARAIQRRALSLPPVDDVLVRDLERLVAERRPR